MARDSPMIALPFQSAPCIGHHRGLSRLAQLLSDPGCRLLTLLGPRENGKSRPALEIVARHTDDFSDGVACVPLVSIGTPVQILSVTHDTFGHAALSGRTYLDLLRFLSKCHMLLVFDNFEHLLESADPVAEILRNAVRVRYYCNEVGTDRIESTIGSS